MATKRKWPLTRIVEISWFDANARSSWGSRQDYMEHNIAPVLTTGYLFKEDERQVMIVSSQGVDFDDCNGGISIPKSWIAKMKVVRK